MAKSEKQSSENFVIYSEGKKEKKKLLNFQRMGPPQFNSKRKCHVLIIYVKIENGENFKNIKCDKPY